MVFPCPIPVKWPHVPLQGGEFWSLRGEAICPRPRYVGHGGYEDSSPGPCGSLGPRLRRRNRLLEFSLQRWRNGSSLPLAPSQGPGMAMACPCLADGWWSQRSGPWPPSELL